MGFRALEFIFDDVAGSKYNLYLADANSKGDDSQQLGYNHKIIRDSTNVSENYTFGMVNNEPLKFPITFMSDLKLDTYDISAISRWLFATTMYKKLQLVTRDGRDIYWMCKLNNPEPVKIGNVIRGLTCEVECDSPFGYERVISIAENKSTSDLTIPIYNDSDCGGIIHTMIKLYANKANGTASIINGTNECSVTNLQSGEIITLNSRYKIIESNQGVLNFERFNGNFIALNSNMNNIIIKGDVNKIEVEYQLKRCMGV